MSSKATIQKQNYERVACIFQGGGSLGAYQVGAFKAIIERGYKPNFYAGVSMGAINCAIIAGNPPEKQYEQLIAFWGSLSPRLWSISMSSIEEIDFLNYFYNQTSALHALCYGVEGFFKPRIIPPLDWLSYSLDELSYYDISPLKSTLEKFVDFDRINSKELVLCLGAVKASSGEVVYFNNQEIRIEPEHVIASCSLPPSFPAIKIEDEYYWDGGVFANTPLFAVVDLEPCVDTLCFAVDCFSLSGEYPQNMEQLRLRIKNIQAASRTRRLTEALTRRRNLQKVIKFLGEKLPLETKREPYIQKLLKLGEDKRLSVVHLIHAGLSNDNTTRSYNFSPAAIRNRILAGYKEAIAVLKDPQWENMPTGNVPPINYGFCAEYFGEKRKNRT